jgi:hypothetical protein
MAFDWLLKRSGFSSLVFGEARIGPSLYAIGIESNRPLKIATMTGVGLGQRHDPS